MLNWQTTVYQILKTVLFGIPASDFHTLILTVAIFLQFKNTYWVVNGLSVENEFSLSLSSLSLSKYI